MLGTFGGALEAPNIDSSKRSSLPAACRYWIQHTTRRLSRAVCPTGVHSAQEEISLHHGSRPCNEPKGTRNAPGCVEHLQARTPRSHSLQAAGPTVPTPPLGLLHPADWRVPSVTSLLHFIAFGSGLWAITVGRLSI